MFYIIQKEVPFRPADPVSPFRPADPELLFSNKFYVMLHAF